MQTDLETNYPLLDIEFAGVNWAGLESANAQFTEGRNLPWLQDMDYDSDGTSDVWDDWETSHLDLVVLDGNNEPAGWMNLITYGLEAPENHTALRDALIDVAMVSQKPWHNADDPLDVDRSGFVVPLDALMIINRLDSIGSERLPPPVGNQPPPPYYDVNGDGDSTPLDVLLVINLLNAQSPAGAGEGELLSQPAQLSAEDAESAAPWRGGMPLAASAGEHSPESSTFASYRLATESRDGELPNDLARQTQTDRVFSAAYTDWLRFNSASLDTDTGLDLLGQFETSIHA